MGDKTSISWTDATWNPVRGCSRVSEGCRNCYAERVAARFSDPGQAYEGLADRNRKGSKWTGVVRVIDDHLGDPLRWKRGRRIFVNSMSDLFHESLTNEEIAVVFGIMAACPQHTFQVLTKRAKRMREWFEWIDRGVMQQPPVSVMNAALDALPDGTRLSVRSPAGGPDRAWPLPNVWLGVSVENQDAAEERVPDLLATPAAARFLSCEPLLGALELDRPRCDGQHCGEESWGVADDDATPWCGEHDQELSYGHWLHLDGGIDWVIAGCESGPGARPCNVEWLRSLRDQCGSSGTAFFLKQAMRAHDVCDECGRQVIGWASSPTTASYSCGCTTEGSEDGAATGIHIGDGARLKGRDLIELPYLDGVQHAAFPVQE